ncbi:MAG TPA: hypothetical protein VMU02_01665 [bacterium]|nr:hypothetical protein [bacterium]
MSRDKCNHSWTMTDVKYGFIVTEKCYHCNLVRTYFTFEEAPPKEEYKEGAHYWNYEGSAQSIKFNMRCGQCSKVVTFEDLMGLMQCMACDEACHVNIISQICEAQNIWVYAGLAYKSGKEIDLPAEKLDVLTTYFTSRLRTPGKKILVLPGSLRKNPETCRGEILKDVGMVSLTPET